ncbi:MAG: hypothetical protein EOM05_09405 [Clostridia bacterium]|nr:hypothetical protein [Erysipelotrichia bacterium]NCC88064.1 hypothetical protein [Clostridia bacterium]
MNEFMIKDDQIKLLCYTLLNLMITIALMLITAIFYAKGIFIVAFFAITGIWFSVKAMYKYGIRFFKKTPVCEFKTEEVIIHSLPEDSNTMKYKDIKEVKILRDKKSVKLFFAGDQVKHPSGWNYAGAVYFFQRNLLAEVEQKTIQCLQEHHVNYSVVKKG